MTPEDPIAEDDYYLLMISLGNTLAEVNKLRSRLDAFCKVREIDINIQNMSISDIVRYCKHIERIRK